MCAHSPPTPLLLPLLLLRAAMAPSQTPPPPAVDPALREALLVVFSRKGSYLQVGAGVRGAGVCAWRAGWACLPATWFCGKHGRGVDPSRGGVLSLAVKPTALD